MVYTYRTSCPVMALRAYFENCTAPPRAALFHLHISRPLTSRAKRAILKDLLLRGWYDTSKYNPQTPDWGSNSSSTSRPPTIHHPAAEKMEQHCLHRLHLASTNKPFRHSYSSISTMTPLHTHSCVLTLLPGTKSPSINPFGGFTLAAPFERLP